MIVEARQLDVATRDVAPQPGELVMRSTRAPNVDGSRVQQPVRRVVAHFPVLGMWEVAVEGVRKPEVTITVRRLAHTRTWQEVAGR
jgi:hypothetical protein